MGATAGTDRAAAADTVSSLKFPELARVRDTADHWPEGYDRQVLLRWGDAIFADSPEFDLATIDGPAAERQFGYNNDFTAFLPLPLGSQSRRSRPAGGQPRICRPLPDVPRPHRRGLSRKADRRADPRHHGGRPALSVVEVKRNGAAWEVVKDGQYNRRIHMGTEMAISGPAAGDDRLKTKADPTGTVVFGTISNCNGGITPWGTMLSGEEGAMDVFAGDYTTLPNQELVERQGWDEDENDIYSVSPHRAALQVRERAQRVDEVRLGGRDRSVRSRPPSRSSAPRSAA